MSLPIVEDFPAIHARLRELEAAARPAADGGAAPQPTGASPKVPAQYSDFYGWLTGGQLYMPAAPANPGG